MKDTAIFTAALKLIEPWYIKSLEFTTTPEGKEELHIEVGCRSGAKFKDCSIYDHQERTWRHLGFFQHACYLHARVPRIKTKDGHVKLVEVPWAAAGSSFTLLFELYILDLLRGGMSASSAGHQVGLDSRVVFRIVSRHVSLALSTQDIGMVKELSVDETSQRKGHNYLTIMSDRDAKKVVGIAIGKDKEAFANALIDMEVRGADRHEVRTLTMDMSKSYIAAADEFMPCANIVFDRFHIMKLLNEAVDKIRRSEQQQYQKAFAKSRYLFLYNRNKLSADKKKIVDDLSEAYPTVGTAYRLKELFREIFNQAEVSAKLAPINKWIKEAWASGLVPFRDFVNTLHCHWYGIKSYFKRQASNAFAEGINLKIQDIKRRARGYRVTHHFIQMIYFHLGGLEFGTHYKW